jgi:Raf kinase inhibitor-like YbhB/YbcL family protein
MAFQLFSNAFPGGGWIPDRNTCQGADLSPALEWSGEPQATRSFALIVDDPDAPGGTWTHWVLFDIPAKTHNLPQGFKPGSVGVSGLNDFKKAGYGGPCPPKGHGAHRYFFKLFALDRETLGLAERVKQGDVEKAIMGHVLAQVQFMGRFERK